MGTALNIPEEGKKRIVIVGCGFAGLELAKKLKRSNYQIVLLDKNSYHQFQPLFYQVATAGLEPRDIAFPIRKIFHNQKNVFIRITEVLAVDSENKSIETTIGSISYDYLVLANGATTSFFGMASVEQNAIPMKSVQEALVLLNSLLHNYEEALLKKDVAEQDALMNVVVVGGGPTGVELSGALAEMKRYVFPKDYPELDCSRIRIILVEASPRLLNGMSEFASRQADRFLKKLGVEVLSDTQVMGYDGNRVEFKNGEHIATKTLVWAAGIAANVVPGLRSESYTRGRRLTVNRINQVDGYDGVFAIGDAAYMVDDEKWPGGHPQVAQVAIQQAKNLAKNFILMADGKEPKPFRYINLGTMATIGRNKAVVDLSWIKFKGLFAWMIWMFIHLRSIFGVKNKILVFVNWVWSYLTYDQSLRLTFLPKGFKFKSVH